MKNLVKVIWTDIAGINTPDNEGAWFTKDQAVKEAQRLYVLEYESVGSIIHNNGKYIVIAATSDNEVDPEPLYLDISMIPLAVIKKIIPLQEAEDETLNKQSE